MKTLQESISKEVIERIENMLTAKVKFVENRHRDAIIFDDYNEIELLAIANISNEYFQIPLFEIEKQINEIYPFVSELEIKIIPYMGCSYSDSSQVARTSVTHFFTNSDVSSLTDEQYEEFQLLLDELQELYDDLRIGLKVEFESIENEEQSCNQLLSVIDIYERW
jgi:hypothetical protein